MKKPLTEYKAIFFDAGDTLVTIPAAHEIMQAYLDKRSYPRQVEQLESLLAEAITHFYYNKKDYTNEIITPETDRSFWMNIYQFVFRRMEAGEVWTDEEILHCCHELYDVFVSPDYYSLFSDVKSSLKQLQDMGFRLGLISNFAPTLEDICVKQGIRHCFDPFIVSTVVGLEKPNPAIFTLALERAGLEAKDVLYIGDHVTNDIWAPAQVGMDALRIIRYEGFSGEGIRTLTELFA